MGALATRGMVTPQALPACVPRTAVFASRQCRTGCRPSRRTLRCQVLAVGCLQETSWPANRPRLGPSHASIAPALHRRPAAAMVPPAQPPPSPACCCRAAQAARGTKRAWGRPWCATTWVMTSSAGSCGTLAGQRPARTWTTSSPPLAALVRAGRGSGSGRRRPRLHAELVLLLPPPTPPPTTNPAHPTSLQAWPCPPTASPGSAAAG
jgi:hypothetical protein